MRKIFITLLAVGVLISCSNHTNKPGNAISKFCSNKLELLRSFDTVPIWEGDLSLINNDLFANILPLFDGEVCDKDLRFNIIHSTDSIEDLKLSVYFHYTCDNSPIYVRERNDWFIILNSRGQLMFDGEILNIDSLDNKLYSYYTGVGKNDFYPYSYNDISICLLWDKEVREGDFKKFIDQIIEGYLAFVSEFSRDNYSKNLCELKKEELFELSKKIPLNIEIPFVITVEEESDLEIDNIVFRCDEGWG